MITRPLVDGWCLLCRKWGQVLWIGPVEHDRQRAPVYACEPCCQFIRHYISQYNAQWDQRPAS